MTTGSVKSVRNVWGDGGQSARIWPGNGRKRQDGQFAVQIIEILVVADEEKSLPKLGTLVSCTKLPTTFAGRGLYGKSRLDLQFGRGSYHDPDKDKFW